jgi:hypothetical protein
MAVAKLSGHVEEVEFPVEAKHGGARDGAAAVPPNELAALIKVDMPKWAKVIHDAGIKP